MKFIPTYLGAFGLMLLTWQLQAATFYVNINGTNPTPPYAGWNTAATNIQNAIDAASAGDLILVTNDIYQTGGKIMAGTLTNRVALDKAVTVQSVNGPWDTVIQGSQSVNSAANVRCAWLTTNAIINGFTFQTGATRSVTGNPDESMYGGGVLGASTNAMVCNSIIATNFASYQGSGADWVTLIHLMGNHAGGSGRPGVGVADAGIGGGAESCNLINGAVLDNAKMCYLRAA